MRLLLLTTSLLASGLAGGEILQSAAALAATVFRDRKDDVAFFLEGDVTFTTEDTGSTFGLRDATGDILLYSDLEIKNPILRAGDRIRVTGKTQTLSHEHMTFAACDEIAMLRHSDAPAPALPPVSPRRLQSGEFDCRQCVLTGTVRDVFSDDIDPDWTYLVIEGEGESVYAPVRTPDCDRMKALVGSSLSLTGVCIPGDVGWRAQLGRIFRITDPEKMRILGKAGDPFNAPDLERIKSMRPSEIAACGRRRIVGRVIAVWHGNQALIRTPDGSAVRLEIPHSPLPAYGTTIEAIGFPETDLYHIRLSRAIWRPARALPPAEEPSSPVSLRSLFCDEKGRPRIDSRFGNRLIRTEGTVKSVTVGESSPKLVYLEDEDQVIAVDVSALGRIDARLRPGCRIEVRGICVMETECWRQNHIFPKINSMTIVARQSRELTILSEPSWWTPSRLLAMIAGLLALLVGSFAWNRLLNRIVERKGRALLKEHIGHIRADLKVDERTRLAADLHDSLSQNLTGIAMQMDLIRRINTSSDPRIARHLRVASQMLQSCRNEMRGCIWDLRNQALDEPSMDRAVRTTLQPHLEDISLFVRFSVPRSRLSDNTVHTILRILRELVSNAIRHGRATVIRIAGTLDRSHIRMSVTDNGLGFDPESRATARDGHFGLDGIAERLRHFAGSIDIASSSGRGTRVEISLAPPEIGEEPQNEHP